MIIEEASRPPHIGKHFEWSPKGVGWDLRLTMYQGAGHRRRRRRRHVGHLGRQRLQEMQQQHAGADLVEALRGWAADQRAGKGL